MSYDADGVAQAKRNHHRMNMMKMSPEAMEERSMKRKLEIFRGTGEAAEAAARQPTSSRPRHHSREDNINSPPASPPSSRQARSDDLVLSSDEEELVINGKANSQSRKRFACGMGQNSWDRIVRNGSPIAGAARKFFTEAQKPFGLCFATPVRTASMEDIANLSDDKLTDDEYLRKHVGGLAAGDDAGVEGMRGGGGCIITPQSCFDSPGQVDPSTSYCEEETISSTLYFDQKYSHVVQTRPPMPLFEENIVDCNGFADNDLSKIIKRRSDLQAREAYRKNFDPPVMELVTTTTTNNASSPSRTKLLSKKKKRGSPFRASPFRASAGNNKSVTSSATTSPISNIKYSLRTEEMQMPPSPIRIGEESLSHESQEEEYGEDVLRTPSNAAEF